MTVLVSLFVVLTAVLNLQYLNVKITSSWKLSEGVELNPRLHEVIRSVQGSFSEGNVAPFRANVGRQCTRNVLLLICWSVVRDIALYATGSNYVNVSQLC